MSTPAEQCKLIYDRVLPGAKSPERIRCTYIDGHEVRCSFETIKVVDEAEAAERLLAERRSSPRKVRKDIADEVTEFLVLVENGQVDEYLELVLSVAHDRKRARRGVRGFPRESSPLDRYRY